VRVSERVIRGFSEFSCRRSHRVTRFALAQREVREREGERVRGRREEKLLCSKVVETAETRPSVAGLGVKLADALSGMRTLMKAKRFFLFLSFLLSTFYFAGLVASLPLSYNNNGRDNNADNSDNNDSNSNRPNNSTVYYYCY